MAHRPPLMKEMRWLAIAGEEELLTNLMVIVSSYTPVPSVPRQAPPTFLCRLLAISMLSSLKVFLSQNSNAPHSTGVQSTVCGDAALATTELH